MTKPLTDQLATDPQKMLPTLREYLVLMNKTKMHLSPTLVNNILRALIRELERSNGWRPIETAPRDGSCILVAKFGANEAGEDCGFWWASKAFFDDKKGCWHDGLGRLSWPTHFMLLLRMPDKETRE